MAPLVADVLLWDVLVGAVAELDDGRVVFEYDEGFAARGWPISPRHLPVDRLGPIEFPALYRSDAFAGLPGVLADALPDRFGNAVIRRYFEERGRPDAALSPVQRLLYVGDRAMGALRFAPAVDVLDHAGAAEALEVAALVADARRVIEGSPDVAVPEMMQIAASAGGARAKAVVLFEPATGRIRSSFAPPLPGDEAWLIKFDGVGDLERRTRDIDQAGGTPHNRVEYVYHLLAVRAGIDMMPCRLLEHDGLAHFMTKRFDRNIDRPPHMHTLGGYAHVDYNVPGLFSYEEYLRAVLELTASDGAVEAAFRRAAFNVLAVNQDDHVKNMAFLLRPDGTWSLSPAYDLTHARGRNFTRQHQMSLAGKRDDITQDDLMQVAQRYGVRQRGRAAIDAVVDALEAWPQLAAEHGVPQVWVDAIGAQHRARIEGYPIA